MVKRDGEESPDRPANSRLPRRPRDAAAWNEEPDEVTSLVVLFAAAAAGAGVPVSGGGQCRSARSLERNPEKYARVKGDLTTPQEPAISGRSECANVHRRADVPSGDTDAFGFSRTRSSIRYVIACRRPADRTPVIKRPSEQPAGPSTPGARPAAASCGHGRRHHARVRSLATKPPTSAWRSSARVER